LKEVNLEKRYIDSCTPQWKEKLEIGLKGRTLFKREGGDRFFILDPSEARSLRNIPFNKEQTAVNFEQVANTEKKKSKLLEYFGWVIFNPHVNENPKSLEKAMRTVITYGHDNPKVNAGAGYVPEDGEEENKKGKKENVIYVIQILDGYLNFVLAIDAIFKVNRLEKVKMLRQRYKHNDHAFPPDELENLINDLPSEAKEFEHPLLSCFFAIAHELGHICYDHVFSPRYEDRTLDESRNMERDADSFASSVINRAEFSSDLFSSQLKTYIAWTIVEKEGGKVEPGTHPLSYERLINFVRNNSALAKNLGIDESWIIRIFG
jgi:hypothetical protein